MKKSDRNHKWGEWSDEDGVYVGKCPDLITGILGDDPKKVYADLCEVVEDVIVLVAKRRGLKPAATRSVVAPRRGFAAVGGLRRFDAPPVR